MIFVLQDTLYKYIVHFQVSMGLVHLGQKHTEAAHILGVHPESLSHSFFQSVTYD